MIKILQGKRILLGVTGSIACYKAAELASRLAQGGAQVQVVLTAAAQQFITPLVFQSVTGQRAYVDADMWGAEGHVQHIGLAQDADLLVIAPASANTIAKMAHGLADNLLSVTALAARCPLLLAPAMDGGMYVHPATQANLAILKERGVDVIGPAEGHLASGLTGLGRMVEAEEILGHIRVLLGRSGALKGRRVVVTAGGTQEPLDPVRVIANRSSGKQGYALAQAALDAGAAVTLISGPTALKTPVGASRIDVGTAEQMLEAVLQALPHADALLMAAAVADFRPIRVQSEKIKKEDGVPSFELECTPDILAQAAQIAKNRPSLAVIGFAAESRDLVANASRKLMEKNLDLIVANDITASDAGFSVDDNRITLLHADGRVEALPLMSKIEAAEHVIDRLAAILESKGEEL